MTEHKISKTYQQINARIKSGEAFVVTAEEYGTDYYPNRKVEKEVTLPKLPNAVLCNPRNAQATN